MLVNSRVGSSRRAFVPQISGITPSRLMSFLMLNMIAESFLSIDGYPSKNIPYNTLDCTKSHFHERSALLQPRQSLPV